MMETRLHSNSDNLELHGAGNAWWVLHSNHLTDSSDLCIFVQKTLESKIVIWSKIEYWTDAFARSCEIKIHALDGVGGGGGQWWVAE